ncbi:hypothetical protein HDC36_003173 [Xanthomonas sp. JAI131]|nr:hypothetical protein [Xanthomonas sp. JAI131]
MIIPLRIRAARTPLSGGAGHAAQHGQRQVAQQRAFQQVASHVQAGTAGGTATGAHGQLGHGAAAGIGGFADLAIGDPIADADVHDGVGGGRRGLRLPPFKPK